MSTFVGIRPFSKPLWVAMETMHFHIAQTKFFLRTPSFRIQGVPMNNLAPMKNCPGGGGGGGGGVHGNLNCGCRGIAFNLVHKFITSYLHFQSKPLMNLKIFATVQP